MRSSTLVLVVNVACVLDAEEIDVVKPSSLALALTVIDSVLDAAEESLVVTSSM